MNTDRRTLTRRSFLAGTLAAAAPPDAAASWASDPDWPMLAHDAARSGATRAEVRPPFERKWYRLFADEGLQSGVQPIVSGGAVFVGTLRGVLHAIDGETGEDRWATRTGVPILHACAAAGGLVVSGSCDGSVRALRVSDGTQAWSCATDAALWNAPAISEDTVYIGGRDSRLRALDLRTGAVRWKARTVGPILHSPAVDARAGRVYVGAEDMRVYAFDRHTGREVWRSAVLPGVSFRGYYPVIAPDGSVLVTATPALPLDTIGQIMLDMVREVFGDFASWRHTKDENERLREANFKLMEQPGTYSRQMAYIRRRLTAEAACRTFFILDPGTGAERCIAPIVYAESMNGGGMPPVVTPAGRVIVKYQALLRSRYEHYSPFLNVGYLDTQTGDIEPIMDQKRTYGWFDSLLLVHDEQSQLSVGGSVLINTHHDNVNGMDLATRKGMTAPFARGVHEPEPGEAIGIWARILRGETLPPGKEWLARGTAVYGGGSAIDVPVSIAGDSFYYIPTHEISAGAAVIAYRSRPDASTPESPKLEAKLTDDEWRRVQTMPWDWDTLETPRLRSVLAALPGSVAGTRRRPLTDQTAAADAIPDADLDALIWHPVPTHPSSPAPVELRAELERAVDELISHDWRPLLFPPGKHPVEAYRFFVEPAETLEALATAYPALPPPLQGRVRRYVADRRSKGGPFEGCIGTARFVGPHRDTRSPYNEPSEKLLEIEDDIVRHGLARLYPYWLWRQAANDDAGLRENWPRLRALYSEAGNAMAEDCRNGHVAGLIAYCRLAREMDDLRAVLPAVIAARSAMRERVRYELEHPAGGVMSDVAVGRTIFSRWRNLTPEVGRLIGQHAGAVERGLMSVYIDHHRPAWWVAWNVELMWRNEAPFSLPTMSNEVFAARALILGERGATLRRFIDIPWSKGDVHYVRKLALCVGSWAEPGTDHP